jgi:thiamine-monophosphate kinase
MLGGFVAETLADLGEFAIIDRIKEIIGDPIGIEIGAGDDAAVFDHPGSTVASVDTVIEGRHFKPEWCAPSDIGRRATAAAMADIAAMGGRPTGVLVALGLPAETMVGWVEDILRGAQAECDVVSAVVLGGDLARSDTVTVSITAIGSVPAGKAVTRAGARPGDVVAIAGRQGWAAAGLTVLSRGFRSPRTLVGAYQRPNPPYESGPDAVAAGATAMIDVSDGLLGDVRHIAIASDVLIELEAKAIPVADQLLETSSAFNVDPLTWVLAGGDDHALVATFPADARVPEMFTQIGQVLESTETGPGVNVDGRLWSGKGGGHDHFRS